MVESAKTSIAQSIITKTYTEKNISAHYLILLLVRHLISSTVKGTVDYHSLHDSSTTISTMLSLVDDELDGKFMKTCSCVLNL